MTAMNLSILERNICAGFDDEQEDLFLRLMPRVGLRIAEDAANAWRPISDLLDVGLPRALMAYGQHPEVEDEVRAFILERFFNLARIP